MNSALGGKFPIGVMAREVHGTTLSERFAAIRRLGFDCVQFNFNCLGMSTLPDVISDELAGQLQEALTTNHLSLAAISGTFNCVHPEHSVRAREINACEYLFSRAHVLGISIITLCTGTKDAATMWRWHPDNDSPDTWRDLIATMKTLSRVAERWRVTLAFEPEVNNVANSIFREKRLIVEVDSERLKVVADPANLFRPANVSNMRGVIDDLFDKLGGLLALAHAKDIILPGNDEQELIRVAVGERLIDFPYYLNRLSASGYDGGLIIHNIKEEQMSTNRGLLASSLEEIGTKRPGFESNQ